MIRKSIVMVLALGTAITLGCNRAPDLSAAHEFSTSKVLGSIDIPSGEHTGDVSTVNGGVHIGSDAIVGHAHSVNGNVRLDSRATATDAGTINGSVDVRDGARVTGNVHTINGSMHVSDAADVSGTVSNVNGSIRIAAAHVGGSIDTTNGNIDLGPNAHIDGNVVMHANNGRLDSDSNIPHVVVERGTVVKGTLRFERPVRLYVSDRASIGTVQGASVVRFSGDGPPE